MTPRSLLVFVSLGVRGRGVQRQVEDASAAVDDGHRTAAIQMVSARRGFVVLARTVVGTTDAQHWNRLYRVGEDLSYVDAVDAVHIWAVGPRSLFASTDGGGHWLATSMPKPFTMVHFVNPALGWAVGDGSLFQTSDGGQSWQNASAPCPVDRVCFADSMHGWAASGMLAYVTSDGGAHWTRRLYVGDPNFARASAVDMQCTPTNVLWVLFDSNNPGLGHDGYAAYRCPPADPCPLVVQSQLADGTADTEGPGSTPGPFSVIDEHTAAFVGYTGPLENPTSIMIVGNDGRDRSPIYRVPNGLTGQVSAQSVSFVSAARGWIVDGDSTIGTRILGTTDGGKTWTVEYRATIS